MRRTLSHFSKPSINSNNLGAFNLGPIDGSRDCSRCAHVEDSFIFGPSTKRNRCRAGHSHLSDTPHNRLSLFGLGVDKDNRVVKVGGCIDVAVDVKGEIIQKVDAFG